MQKTNKILWYFERSLSRFLDIYLPNTYPQFYPLVVTLRTFLRINSIFFPFYMDKIMKNTRGLELFTSLSLGCKTCLEKIFFSDLSPGEFCWYKVVSELFQKLHLLISTSQFTTSVIPVSCDPLNLENMELKEKNYKKLSISKTERAF